MNKKVLLFNISSKDERMKISTALLPLKIGVNTVLKEDYKQSIGYLSGNKQMPKTDEVYDGEELDGKMMLFSGFDGVAMEKALDSLKKQGISKECLKAVLTYANSSWNVLQLYEEIKAERDIMNGHV